MKKLLADLVKVDAFLASISIAWAVVAATLSQFGVPVKVVSIAGASLVLATFLLGKAIVAAGGTPPASTTISTGGATSSS
jgi:hypothetical protein